jgi:DNA repair exonuclease SbcCD ATPase subunit
MLTINDVENYKFGSAMFGASRADVEEFVAQVAAGLQEHVDEIERLKRKLADAEAEIQRNRANEDTLRNSIMLAQKSHDEIISSARHEAENILKEARLQGVELNSRAAEISAERERFEYEFYGLLTGFIHALEAKNPALKGHIQTAGTAAAPSAVPAVEPAAPTATGRITFPEETPR